MNLNVIFLGKCDYKKALEIQYHILDKRQKGEMGDTLILVEHPPVLTKGRHAEESNIVVSEEYLKNMGIDVYEINRGGDVTYHGDGQIVGYPIIDLRNIRIGIKDFVRKLEELFIQLLKDRFDIDAERDPLHTGVWVGKDKITAIGLEVKKGVTMHGFAFNVNTILEHFQFIVPCGITDKGVTSIEKLKGEKVDLYDINQLIPEYFSKIFKYNGYTELDFQYNKDN